MLFFDTECYENYWLLAMLDSETNVVTHYETYPGGEPLDKTSIRLAFKNNTTVGFNSHHYDMPMIVMALRDKTTEELKVFSDMIIKSGKPGWMICQDAGIQIPATLDMIDIINVAPGRDSLKSYGARLGVQKLQDLPFDPSYLVKPEDRLPLRQYCENDLYLTKALYYALEPEIKLRADMSKQYGMDLRSQSDAQIAETIIRSELMKITGKTYKKPNASELPTSIRYQDPKFIKFRSPLLNRIYRSLLDETFEVNSAGRVDMPKWLKDMPIVIGGTQYAMGIGGLHSKEKSQLLVVSEGMCIADMDVASYYPNIIMSQKVVPDRLGAPFLRVYQSLITRRLAAKHAGDVTTANSLKIAVNGSFGKTGSIYSFLYAPEMLIQTTITGQLALLMLIERLEAEGIAVRSANTDGIVCVFCESDEHLLAEIAWNWELDTSYELERNDYSLLASRDVNNYVAITSSGKVKTKGTFAPPFYAADKPNQFNLMKNPANYICPQAVIAYLQHKTPIAATVRNCADVRNFLYVTKVTGGATWRGEPVGKTVRFYKSTEVSEEEALLYTINGHKVPTSAGCKPLMDLPGGLSVPADMDYDYYIDASIKLLAATGVTDA